MKGAINALQRLRALPVRAQRAADETARFAAADALKKARSLSPVRTGRLRASLETGPAPGGAKVLTECPYAVYVELGTRCARAQPYLTPALRAVPFADLLARALKEAIK